MIRLLQQVIGSEKGQALLIVLALLVLGGLTIVPALNYATTSLNSGRNIAQGVNGLYAADAGVEDTLWCLGNGISPSEQLSDNVNQMEVAIQTEDKGNYTIYFGEFIQSALPAPLNLLKKHIIVYHCDPPEEYGALLLLYHIEVKLSRGFGGR